MPGMNGVMKVPHDLLCVPIIRTAVATDEVKRVLNEISAKLTTADLVGLNAQVELQHQDADVATKAWLESHGYGM